MGIFKVIAEPGSARGQMDYGVGSDDEDAPIPSGRGAALSLKEAMPFTRQWIDNRMSLPGRGYYAQMRMVMYQLATAALAETIKTGGDGYAYQDRLSEAYDIL